MGAVLTPPFLFLWCLVWNARSGPTQELFGELIGAVILGLMLGPPVGAVGGWIWLVVAVGRESRQTARRTQVNGGCDRLPPDPPHGNQDA